jgi:toxin ParE1/3/4
MENPEAARRLVRHVFERVELLASFPGSGRRIPEFPDLPGREGVVPPCRVIHRGEGDTIWVIQVARTERILRRGHFDAWTGRRRFRPGPKDAGGATPCYPTDGPRAWAHAVR